MRVVVVAAIHVLSGGGMAGACYFLRGGVLMEVVSRGVEYLDLGIGGRKQGDVWVYIYLDTSLNLRNLEI